MLWYGYFYFFKLPDMFSHDSLILIDAYWHQIYRCVTKHPFCLLRDFYHCTHKYHSGIDFILCFSYFFILINDSHAFPFKSSLADSKWYILSLKCNGQCNGTVTGVGGAMANVYNRGCSPQLPGVPPRGRCGAVQGAKLPTTCRCYKQRRMAHFLLQWAYMFTYCNALIFWTLKMILYL